MTEHEWDVRKEVADRILKAKQELLDLNLKPLDIIEKLKADVLAILEREGKV